MAVNFEHSEDCSETCCFLRAELERKGNLAIVHLAGSMGHASERVRCRAGRNDYGIRRFIQNHPSAFIYRHKKDLVIRRDNYRGKISRSIDRALRFLHQRLKDRGHVGTQVLLTELGRSGKAVQKVLYDEESLLWMLKSYPDLFLVCHRDVSLMPSSGDILSYLLSKETAPAGAVEIKQEDAAILYAQVENPTPSYDIVHVRDTDVQNAKGFLKNLLWDHGRMRIADIAKEGRDRLPIPVRFLLENPVNVETFVKRFPDSFAVENNQVILLDNVDMVPVHALSAKPDMHSSTQSLPAMIAYASSEENISCEDPIASQNACGFIRNRMRKSKKWNIEALAKEIKNFLPSPAKNIVDTPSKLEYFLKRHSNIFQINGQIITVKELKTSRTASLKSKELYGSSQSLPAVVLEESGSEYCDEERSLIHEEARNFIRGQLMEHKRMHVFNLVSSLPSSSLTQSVKEHLDSPEKITRFVQWFPEHFNLDGQNVTLTEGYAFSETSSCSSYEGAHQLDIRNVLTEQEVRESYEYSEQRGTFTSDPQEGDILLNQKGTIILISGHYGVIQSAAGRVYFKDAVCDFIKDGSDLKDQCSVGQCIMFDAVVGPRSVAYPWSATHVCLVRATQNVMDEGIPARDSQEYDGIPRLYAGDIKSVGNVSHNRLSKQTGTVTLLTKHYGMLSTEHGYVYFKHDVCSFWEDDGDLRKYITKGQRLLFDAVAGPDNVWCQWVATKVDTEENQRTETLFPTHRRNFSEVDPAEKLCNSTMNESETGKNFIEGNGIVISVFTTFALLQAFDSTGHEITVYFDRETCDFSAENGELAQIISEGDELHFKACHVPDGEIYKWVALNVQPIIHDADRKPNDLEDPSRNRDRAFVVEEHPDLCQFTKLNECKQDNVAESDTLLEDHNTDTLLTSATVCPGHQQIREGTIPLDISICEQIPRAENMTQGDDICFIDSGVSDNETIKTVEEKISQTVDISKTSEDELVRKLRENVEKTRHIFEENICWQTYEAPSIFATSTDDSPKSKRNLSLFTSNNSLVVGTGDKSQDSQENTGDMSFPIYTSEQESDCREMRKQGHEKEESVCLFNQTSMSGKANPETENTSSKNVSLTRTVDGRHDEQVFRTWDPTRSALQAQHSTGQADVKVKMDTTDNSAIVLNGNCGNENVNSVTPTALETAEVSFAFKYQAVSAELEGKGTFLPTGLDTSSGVEDENVHHENIRRGPEFNIPNFDLATKMKISGANNESLAQNAVSDKFDKTDDNTCIIVVGKNASTFEGTFPDSEVYRMAPDQLTFIRDTSDIRRRRGSSGSEIAFIVSAEDNIFIQTFSFFLFVFQRRHPRWYSSIASVISILSNVSWILENMSPYLDIIPRR